MISNETIKRLVMERCSKQLATRVDFLDVQELDHGGSLVVLIQKGKMRHAVSGHIYKVERDPNGWADEAVALLNWWLDTLDNGQLHDHRRGR